MSIVSTAVILDKRIKRKDSTYSIKLRVTYQRIQKYYPIGKYLMEDEWNELQEVKPKKKYKDLKLYLGSIENRAIEAINALDIFTFERFKKVFNRNVDYSRDVFQLFDEYIHELKSKGQVSTSNSYSQAKNSFKRYLASINRKKLLFGDITPEWLNKYEEWMTSEEQGKTITTVGIYCRSFRKIINNAIEEGLFHKEFYPFGKRKYIIPASRNIKKALSAEDLRKIFEYSTTSIEELKAIDMFKFSYLCNGANFKDIVLLRYSNIASSTLVFFREKTKRTSKANLLPIVVNLSKESSQIIERWGMQSGDADAYIFGFIDEKDSEGERVGKLHQARKITNKYLKRIGIKLKLSMPLTHGVARYCWATRMKQLGAPNEVISEGMGHQSAETTKHYLNSFDYETRSKYQERLLDF